MSSFHSYRWTQFKVIPPGLYTPYKKPTPKFSATSDASSRHAMSNDDGLWSFDKITKIWVSEVSTAATTLATNCCALSLRILFHLVLINLSIIICVSDHVHLHSRTDRRALRAEYCIVTFHTIQPSSLNLACSRNYHSKDI